MIRSPRICWLCGSASIRTRSVRFRRIWTPFRPRWLLEWGLRGCWLSLPERLGRFFWQDQLFVWWEGYWLLLRRWWKAIFWVWGGRRAWSCQCSSSLSQSWARSSCFQNRPKRSISQWLPQPACVTKEEQPNWPQRWGNCSLRTFWGRSVPAWRWWLDYNHNLCRRSRGGLVTVSPFPVCWAWWWVRSDAIHHRAWPVMSPLRSETRLRSWSGVAVNRDSIYLVLFSWGILWVCRWPLSRRVRRGNVWRCAEGADRCWIRRCMLLHGGWITW